jgi:hypothetical protein
MFNYQKKCSLVKPERAPKKLANIDMENKQLLNTLKEFDLLFLAFQPSKEIR